jgi:hypothetical protein
MTLFEIVDFLFHFVFGLINRLTDIGAGLVSGLGSCFLVRLGNLMSGILGVAESFLGSSFGLFSDALVG